MATPVAKTYDWKQALRTHEQAPDRVTLYRILERLMQAPVGVAYAVWSGLGVVIITAIAWLLHGQKLDAWGFVGMGLIIA
uniref:DMT family transporter n=1 Tax=Klebsiella pneumoniae TaxID=573 RepID=UPI0021B151BB